MPQVCGPFSRAAKAVRVRVDASARREKESRAAPDAARAACGAGGVRAPDLRDSRDRSLALARIGRSQRCAAGLWTPCRSIRALRLSRLLAQPLPIRSRRRECYQALGTRHARAPGVIS